MQSSNGERPEPVAALAGLRLRPLEVSDLDQVLQIEADSFASPWKREHFLFELHENPFAVSRVASVEGRVAAYVCTWRDAGELKINNFAVRADCRRSGIGRWMLRETLDEARAAGCERATLEVRESNTAAQRLYAEFGFVEIVRRKGYYHREREDAIVMQASLIRGALPRRPRSGYD